MPMSGKHPPKGSMTGPRDGSSSGPRRGEELKLKETHQNKYSITRSGQQHKDTSSYKQTQEPERYQDDLWYLDQKKKEHFLMFTRVLIKYLESKDREMHHRAMQALKLCSDRNKVGDPEYSSLTNSMRVNLRKTVGEHYWRKAEDYLKDFLHTKGETYWGASSSSGASGRARSSSQEKKLQKRQEPRMGSDGPMRSPPRNDMLKQQQRKAVPLLVTNQQKWTQRKKQDQSELTATIPAPVTPAALAASMTPFSATQKRKKTKKIYLDEVPFDQLEDTYIRKKRENTLAFLRSTPFEMLEQVFHERKRLKSTIDLTSDDTANQEPDGTGTALRIQAEQHAALVKIKVENTVKAGQIMDLQGKIEKEKMSTAANLLSLERVKECVICQAADKCVALYPCSHLALCHKCQHLVDECPICRNKVEERMMVKLV